MKIVQGKTFGLWRNKLREEVVEYLKDIENRKPVFNRIKTMVKGAVVLFLTRKNLRK
jgi:hypothetical protein